MTATAQRVAYHVNADRLLVRPGAVQEKIGTLIAPDAYRERPFEGTVVAVGNGRVTDAGARVSLPMVVGDHVIYAKHAGNEITVDGETLLILRESDVLLWRCSCGENAVCNRCPK